MEMNRKLTLSVTFTCISEQFTQLKDVTGTILGYQLLCSEQLTEGKIHNDKLYTVSQKNCTLFVSSITLSNVDRF